MLRTEQPGPIPVSHRMQHLRCLVADDNDTGREVLGAIVRSFGWHADCVASGAEAVDAARAASYDVVLMDWRMPGMDGLQASEAIRAVVPPEKIPAIVMVTAHDRELITATGGRFAHVVDAMLAKPITASMVFDAVGELRYDGARAAAAPGAPADSAPDGAPDAQALAGVRLLLVDDNAMNQQVARELLLACGAHMTVADCGQAAIDAVRAGPGQFDLILMDIQMPDMDGYATTRAIRAHVGDAAPPIVAMTANAMPADRDAAYAAGMAGHVGKPFDLGQLVEVILRHCGSPAHAAGTDAPAGEAERTTAADTPGGVLNGAAALARLGGDAAIYQLALRGFPAELDKLAPPLLAAMGTDDAPGARPALHTLKGLAGMVGADHLFALVQAAERQLDADAAPARRWSGVEAVLAEAIAAAHAARDGAASGATPASP